MTKEEFLNCLTGEPCQDALDDFDEFSKRYVPSEPFEKVLTDFFLEHPNGDSYYWWCWNKNLPEEFKTDELINGCAWGKPWAALKYAAHHLDEDVLNWCALDAPWAALKYCEQRLKDLDVELFKRCALNAPWHALRYYSNLLDDETFKECALKQPLFTLIYCPQRCDSLGEEFKQKLKRS